MAIPVACPACGKQGQVPDQFAGQKVKCKCGALIAVPAGAPSPVAGAPRPAAPAKAPAAAHRQPSAVPATAGVAPAADLKNALKTAPAPTVPPIPPAPAAESMPEPEPAADGVETPEPEAPVKSGRSGLKIAIALGAVCFCGLGLIVVAGGFYFATRGGSNSTGIVAKATLPATEPTATPPTKAADKASAPPTPPASPDVIFQRASPAVVQVHAHGVLSHQGSGFFLTDDGLVATNYHVIRDASTAEVVTTEGAKYKVEGIAAADRTADLVLLQVAGKGFPTLPLGGKELPTVGSRAYAIGHPKGLANTLSDGLVSGHREIDDGLVMIQTTAPISPGSSGGPLLSPDGKVVGITTSTILGGQNLNLAAPVARLSKLLTARGSLKPLPGPNAEVSLRWNIKLDDVFFIEKVERRLQTVSGNRVRSSRYQYVDLALLRVKVKEINDEGILLDVTIEDLKRTKDGDELNPLTKVLPKASGTTLNVMLSRAHSVLKMDGLQELVKRLADNSDANTQRELGYFGVEHMVQGALDNAFYVGKQSAARGDVWRQKNYWTMGNLGTFQYARVYCFEGSENNIEKISIKGEYKYEPPKGGDAEGNLRAVSGELMVEECKGEVRFDSKARRLVQSEYRSRVRGTLQGKFDLDDTNIDVVLETLDSIRVLDKRPGGK